jgi:hypothetical protein
MLTCTNRGRAPVEANRLFDYVADLRNEGQWNDDTKGEVKLLTGDPIGKGSRFEGTYRAIGTATTEVTTYEPGRKLVLDTDTKMVFSQSEWTFEPHGDETVLEVTIHMQFKGPYRLFGPMMRLGIRKQMESRSAGLARGLGVTSTTEPGYPKVA